MEYKVYGIIISQYSVLNGLPLKTLKMTEKYGSSDLIDGKYYVTSMDVLSAYGDLFRMPDFLNQQFDKNSKNQDIKLLGNVIARAVMENKFVTEQDIDKLLKKVINKEVILPVSEKIVLPYKAPVEVPVIKKEEQKKEEIKKIITHDEIKLVPHVRVKQFNGVKPYDYPSFKLQDLDEIYKSDEDLDYQENWGIFLLTWVLKLAAMGISSYIAYNIGYLHKGTIENKDKKIIEAEKKIIDEQADVKKAELELKIIEEQKK
jgi:hypothetical protein